MVATLVLLAFMPLAGDVSAAATAACSSPLRACVDGSAVGSRVKQLRRYFADVQTGYDPHNCDVRLNYPSGWSWSVEIYSAKSGRRLGRIDNSNEHGSYMETCQSLSSAGVFASEFVQLTPSPAAGRTSAPASSETGVSREELAQMIAAAVQKAPASSPAPVPRATLDAETANELPASPAPEYSAAERPDDLAVIVGVETYSDIAAKASYAERDAEAFKAFVRALGVPERNTVLLTGPKAVRSALTKNIEVWLSRMAKPSSRVYFYFSGHGAPDVKSGQAYLVPWDGDPNFLESTAYPLAQLYQKLGALPVRQVLVAMDSCFSGAGGRSVLASGARPLVTKIAAKPVPAKVTVLAASAGNEISGSLDAKGHGAFTYFLLEGLNAGKTTPRALREYLTPRVQDEARRLNRDQTPQLHGDGSWTLR